MDIFDIYKKYVDSGTDYGQILQVMMMNLGDVFFDLLTEAEKQGKQLQLKENSLPKMWDGFTIEDVEMV